MNTLYNTDIPGWMWDKELIILSTLASLVPENGSILELGCFLGRSTSALYAGKNQNVKLDIVDCFKGIPHTARFAEEKLRGDPVLYEKAQTIAMQSGWENAFRYCIGEKISSDINVFPTLTNNFEISKPYDLTFIDASHSILDVINDINKFSSDEGLLIGDDFIRQHAGVSSAINVTRRDRMVIVFENTKLWVMLPTHGYWREVFKNNNLLFLD